MTTTPSAPSAGAPTPAADAGGWLYAELAADGSASLSLGAKRVELAAPAVPTGDALRAGRAQMLTELRTIAEAVGRPVRVRITDPDGVWPVEVSEDPAISPTALPDAPATAPEPGPASEAEVLVRRVRPVLRPAPDPEPAPPPPMQEPVRRPEPVAGPATDPGAPVPTEVARPSSFDDLLAARPDPYDAPAAEGWRGAVRQLSKGKFRPRPSKAELAHRDRIRIIQRDLDGPKVIVLANPKGGAHKTTSGLQLARKLGTLRGGGVVFYDNNEARATAGWRAMQAKHDRTVDDLLHRLHDLREQPISGISDLRRYLRSQGPAGFDLLAAAEPEDPMQPRHIPASDVDTVLDTLGRFYEIIVVDTGNTMPAPNWGAAVLRADQLVIVSNIREDTALAAGYLAQGLQRKGREELLANAVTVLSAPATTQADLHKQFSGHFQGLTRAVRTVPFDPSLDQGRPIDYNALSDATDSAWEVIAADVMAGL